MSDPLVTYLTELTALAIAKGNTDGIDFTAHADTIRSVVVPAEYCTIGDFAAKIGRNKTTILSWIARNQHGIPPALGKTGNGYIWDGAKLDAWACNHPELLSTEVA